MAKSNANLIQRFWSFESLSGSTMFRLVLICFICSWFAYFVPHILLAPILGVESASVYLRSLLEGLQLCAILAGWNAGLFYIYLAIWRARIREDRTLTTPRLCAIVYGAIFMIAPVMFVLLAAYLGGWEELSSEVEGTESIWTAAGILTFLVMIFVQPVSLIVGKKIGYALGLKFEKRGISLSNKWVIAGTLGFAILLPVGSYLVLSLILWFVLHSE